MIPETSGKEMAIQGIPTTNIVPAATVANPGNSSAAPIKQALELLVYSRYPRLSFLMVEDPLTSYYHRYLNVGHHELAGVRLNLPYSGLIVLLLLVAQVIYAMLLSNPSLFAVLT